MERVESGSRLVQDAGSTMQDIVGAVERVTDIIAEISASAAEQSKGIGDEQRRDPARRDDPAERRAGGTERGRHGVAAGAGPKLSQVVGHFRLD